MSSQIVVMHEYESGTMKKQETKGKCMLSKSGAGENYDNYAERCHGWPINARVLCSLEALVVKQKLPHLCPTIRRQDGMGRRNND